MDRKLHYFTEALKTFERALECCPDAAPSERTKLHWDIATTYLGIAHISGEPVDLKAALDAFEKSVEICGEQPPEFWCALADTALKLAQQLRENRYTIQAIQALRYATSQDPVHFELWSKLADALGHLYALSHEEEHLTEAVRCYETADKLKSQSGELFFSWAKLLFQSALWTKSCHRLKLAVEKCLQAGALDGHSLSVTALWARSLAHIGLWSDRLELIFEAENRMASLLDKHPEDTDLLFAHGTTLHALGTYFKDADYLYQAIEKFQEGLSVNRTLSDLWHAMALSYTAVFELVEDDDAFAKAERFYHKSLNLNPTSTAYADWGISLSKWGELNQDQEVLERALSFFEWALQLQKNAVYVHPTWLFYYGATLEQLSGFCEEESYSLKAIEIFSHLLKIDPDLLDLHYRLALSFAKFADVTGSVDAFSKATHHFRLAHSQESENDLLLIDWAVALVHLATLTHESADREALFQEAESLFIQAAKLGNVQAYYQLAGLFSLMGETEKALCCLEKAEQLDALPTLEEIQEDDWLDAIKHLGAFRTLIARLESRPHPVSEE